MTTSTRELSRFAFADITAIYQLQPDTGAVELRLVPRTLADKLPAHREFLDDPAIRYGPQPAWQMDSLVQVRLADDPCVTAFGNGRTMRNSQATLELKLVHQDASEAGVVTVLENPRGFRCEHRLSWRDGERALRIGTTFVNTSPAPLTVEMLASFSLGGVTPFAADDAPGRLRLTVRAATGLRRDGSKRCPSNRSISHLRGRLTASATSGSVRSVPCPCASSFPSPRWRTPRQG